MCNKKEVSFVEKQKERLLTIKEAADVIEGLTEYQIRRMCRNGKLSAFKAGNKYLIYEEELFLATGKGIGRYEDSSGITKAKEKVRVKVTVKKVPGKVKNLRFTALKY